MSVFDLDESGGAELEQRVRENSVAADDVSPGFFDGGLYGTGMGIARGFSKLGRGIGLAVGGGLVAAEKLGGYDPGEITDSYFDSVIKLTDESVDFFTPAATEVGTVGRVLGGLAEIAAPLALGGGNPIPLVASTGLNTSADLARQGVDTATATTVGLVDASAVGIGFRIPFLGKTFAQKAATGAGGSVALGISATAADRAVLDARGYDELARRYNPLDLEARTVDLLTGIAFGGVAHFQGRAADIARSERDAALAGLNARHFQAETAPGRPIDEIALAAHQRALEQAVRQIQEGKPVDVAESRVTEARFIDAPREAPARDPSIQRVLDELGIRDTPEVRDSPAARALAPDAIVDTPAALGEAPANTGDAPGRTVTPAEATPVPAPARDGAAAAEPARAEAEPARARDGERAEPDDPDVIAAERSIADRDIEIETGLVDADGVAEVKSARVSLAEARQEVAAAKRQATAFEAAVSCALSFGD